MKRINNLKSKTRILLAVFFVLAGINHFWHPDFYFPLIPDYFPWKSLINLLSGVFEVVFGFGLFWDRTRKIAAIGIIILLVAFIPSHIHFIQIGGCVSDSLCVPAWVAWVRLVVVHPLLIAWAWWVR